MHPLQGCLQTSAVGALVLTRAPARPAWSQDCKGEMPSLEEDVLMVVGAGAADAAGKELIKADRQLKFRIGDLPFAEDWVLYMLMTMYHGEKARMSAQQTRRVLPTSPLMVLGWLCCCAHRRASPRAARKRPTSSAASASSAAPPAAATWTPPPPRSTSRKTAWCSL